MKKKIFETLKYYNDIKLPRGLSDTENDEYDFIADNTFFGGIVSQAIQGKDVSKFMHVTDFINQEYQTAKKQFLQKKSGSENYQELVNYFNAYEKAVTALEDYLELANKIIN